MNRTIKEIIRQRRAQMLIHSCIYYELNDNIISDHLWQKWADELQKLQEDHPEECKIDFWDWEFRNWTGATGNHLPHRNPWVYAKAKHILELSRNNVRI
jgi:NAD-dependent DNA ligase